MARRLPALPLVPTMPPTSEHGRGSLALWLAAGAWCLLAASSQVCHFAGFRACPSGFSSHHLSAICPCGYLPPFLPARLGAALSLFGFTGLWAAPPVSIPRNICLASSCRFSLPPSTTASFPPACPMGLQLTCLAAYHLPHLTFTPSPLPPILCSSGLSFAITAAIHSLQTHTYHLMPLEHALPIHGGSPHMGGLGWGRGFGDSSSFRGKGAIYTMHWGWRRNTFGLWVLPTHATKTLPLHALPSTCKPTLHLCGCVPCVPWAF